jgi:hypothetical protein
MRFSIGLLLGFLLGMAATVGYYEFLMPGPDDVTEPAMSEIDK